MASSAREPSKQNQRESIDKKHPESVFSRSAWEKIEHHEHDQAPVTMWIGVASVIVAISIPDVDPDDLEVSVLGTRLLFRGAAPGKYFSQDVELPCAVEAHPIHIPEGKGILYVLLVKKREAEAVRDEGYGDKYPSNPVLTMSGA
jgi:HSP20 family molecular chaperone IbpA